MSNDPAFLWENEGLRSGPRRPRPRAGTPARQAPPAEVADVAPPTGSGDWVSLRDAETRTGIARSTVRNWARKGRIRSHGGTEPGSPRMVDLDDLRRHAAERGYHPPVVSPLAPPSAPAVPAVPEGSMIVPVDAWERILLQLGNLHEAGRDLAEARERAARAETEAMFLRERLAELRGPATGPSAVVNRY